MAKIIRHVDFQDVTVDYYEKEWIYSCGFGGGFSFPCDKDGTIDRTKLCPEAIHNLDVFIPAEVSKGNLKYTGIRHIHYQDTRKIPGLFKCDCGTIHEMGGYDIFCDCGRIFNGSGQELADPLFWGEDTGESYSDIVNGPAFED